MAAGLPVVAAGASGVRDVFPAGEASGGVVVPRGESAQLATALEALLNDDDRRDRLGAAALKRIDDAFTLSAVGSQLRQHLCAVGM